MHKISKYFYVQVIVENLLRNITYAIAPVISPATPEKIFNFFIIYCKCQASVFSKNILGNKTWSEKWKTERYVQNVMEKNVQRME